MRAWRSGGAARARCATCRRRQERSRAGLCAGDGPRIQRGHPRGLSVRSRARRMAWACRAEASSRPESIAHRLGQSAVSWGRQSATACPPRVASLARSVTMSLAEVPPTVPLTHPDPAAPMAAKRWLPVVFGTSRDRRPTQRRLLRLRCFRARALGSSEAATHAFATSESASAAARSFLSISRSTSIVTAFLVPPLFLAAICNSSHGYSVPIRRHVSKSAASRNALHDGPSTTCPHMSTKPGWSGAARGTRPSPCAVAQAIVGVDTRELNRGLCAAVRGADADAKVHAEWAAQGQVERFRDHVVVG